MYNGTQSTVGSAGLQVEREFQKLCRENHVEQLLQDEVKSEMKEENRTEMGDFDVNMPPLFSDGKFLDFYFSSLKGYMDGNDFIKQENFHDFGDEVNKIEAE